MENDLDKFNDNANSTGGGAENIPPLLSERQAAEKVLRSLDLWDGVVKLCANNTAEGVPAWKLRQYATAVLQARTACFSNQASIRFKFSSWLADMVNAEIDKLAPPDELPPFSGTGKRGRKQGKGRLKLPDATELSGGVSNGAGKAIVARRQRVLNSLATAKELLREFKRGGLIGVGRTEPTERTDKRKGKDNPPV